MNRRHRFAWLGAAALVAVAPALASAQSLAYGPADGGDESAAAATDAGGKAAGGAGRRERVKITPYIEAMQVIGADLSPRSEVLTWTALAAGVDGGFKGRNSEGSFSVRYERRIGYGKSEGGDTVSGLVRGAVAVIPHAVTFEAGGVATRTSADGAALPGEVDTRNSRQLWSVYAGPTVQTAMGDVAVSGSYRLGYTEVGSNQTVVRNGAASPAELFDHSVVHDANIRAGLRPGEVLPVGLGAGAGYYREDVGNLDQRVEDFHARADVTVPVSSDLAVVGGVGWERLEISSRDAVRDAGGVPVIGPNGRYVTDRSQPRQLAYETSGLIWDAGVTWRPSRRTALEAHVGWRYGGTTYYGSFGWKPGRRQTVNVAVYDSVTGYGGQMNRAIAALPDTFVVQRNPISGDINGCIAGTERAGCLNGAFGALRSATFRARGIQASYGVELGERFTTGISAGYDRRRFIAAPGTILAAANGVIDENTWLSAWFGGRIDRATTFNTYVYSSWYRSGRVAEADTVALGVNGSLSRSITNHLSANAAVGLQGIQREAPAEDYWNASALVGVRYSF